MDIRKIKSTLDYYNKNAAQYFDSTCAADLSGARKKFASHLSPGARIIDMGCGSGRDVKAFCDAGFRAAGLDASEELARLAMEKFGIEVIVGDMSTCIAEEPYDGIWCCASLLHLSDEEAERFFGNLKHNLAPGGVLYLSVKEGIQNGPDEKGRYMRNYTEAELTEKLEAAGLRLLDLEKTGDTLGRDQFRWINVIAER